MKKLIAGNWKMNGSLNDAKKLISDIINGIERERELLNICDFVVCPPFVHINAIKHTLLGHEHATYGAQDCSAHENGAYTGDVSAAMLADMKCRYVILGHSERRQYHNESNELVALKAARAHTAGLKTIICVGETESEREAGKQEEVVKRQLAGSLPSSANAGNTVIAYEPVWAIGTGKTASAADAGAMHSVIRDELAQKLKNAADIRILYGGSMKPENARELLATPNIDGGLIGGASLKADQFLAIARSALAIEA